MTEQEKINYALQRQMERIEANSQRQLERIDARVQKQLDEQKARMNVMDARIDCALAELKEQRQDIRDLNKKLDAKYDALDKKIDDTFKQTMLGVGGMMIALGAFLVAVLK